MGERPPKGAAFDSYAANYEGALQQGLQLSGESADYFARGRVEWLALGLRQRQVGVRSVLDFGCGTGSAIPHLHDILGAERIVGVDTSTAALERASREHAGRPASFATLGEFQARGEFDLVFSNGTFHHIPPGERAAAMELIARALRPGGLLALWENNPWNPGTRWVMRRIPFDHDAIPLSAPAARRMVGAAGFEILGTDFLFVFPRALRALRPLEPWVARLPLGAQYQVLARRRTG